MFLYDAQAGSSSAEYVRIRDLLSYEIKHKFNKSFLNQQLAIVSLEEGGLFGQDSEHLSAADLTQLIPCIKDNNSFVELRGATYYTDAGCKGLSESNRKLALRTLEESPLQTVFIQKFSIKDVVPKEGYTEISFKSGIGAGFGRFDCESSAFVISQDPIEKVKQTLGLGR